MSRCSPFKTHRIVTGKPSETDLPVLYQEKIIFGIILELPQLNLDCLTSKRTFFSVLIIAVENAFAQPTY